GVDARGESHAERIVSRNGHDSRLGSDEFVQIVWITASDVFRLEFSQQRGFDQAHASRHVARRSVRVVFDLAPARVFFVHHTLHSYWHRSYSHLDEITGVINRFGERRGQHN